MCLPLQFPGRHFPHEYKPECGLLPGHPFTRLCHHGEDGLAVQVFTGTFRNLCKYSGFVPKHRSTPIIVGFAVLINPDVQNQIHLFSLLGLCQSLTCLP